jgi:outer membrane protein
MNNKGSLIVNSILGVAIIILFVLHFSGDTKSNVTDTSGDTKSNVTDTEEKDEPGHSLVIKKHPADSNMVGLIIGYVNSDTLTANYEFNKELSNSLKNQQKSAEKKLKNIESQIEKDFKTFQTGTAIMGEEEYARKLAVFQQRGQDLQMLQMEESKKLQELSYNAEKEYMITTDGYLKQIGEELGYDYILGYRTGDLVMYANPKYDITKQMIPLLNAAYKSNIAGK